VIATRGISPIKPIFHFHPPQWTPTALVIKKIAYGNPKLINALNRSKPSDQSDTRPPSQVDYVCICRNAHHIY
jgi:hypothetical protein